MRRLPILLCPIWLALGACWSIPFLVAPHTYPVPTFYSESAAAACWIVAAVLVLSVAWKRPTGLPSIALAPLALIVVLIAQLAVAPPLNPFFPLAPSSCCLERSSFVGWVHAAAVCRACWLL